MLSAAYTEIKRLRSTGRSSAALETLKTRKPASDADAFEAAVCLFLRGDINNMLHVCTTYPWRLAWAKKMSAALVEMLARDNAQQALALAREAVRDTAVPRDAEAFFLMMLQANGLTNEAYEHVKNEQDPLPVGETFLLTVMAEIAAEAKDWIRAYQMACAAISADFSNYRALIVLSRVNAGLNNHYEALSNALSASQINPGSLPATLQIMRSRNKLGDHYAVIAVFEKISDKEAVTAEIHIELGAAYASLDRTSQAIAAYRSALSSDSPPVEALRALLKIYLDSGDGAALESLAREYAREMDADIECVLVRALEQLRRGAVDEALRLLKICHELNVQCDDAYAYLQWPVAEPRLRHDFEQLDLLRQRGKLSASGLGALKLIKSYLDQPGDHTRTFAPEGSAEVALKKALCDFHHYPQTSFSGPALARIDYRAIEDQYNSQNVVVIDNFLTPAALAELRSYCEEATVWKTYYRNGYVGAFLSKGFASHVLLKIADELRQMMPSVINDLPLLQAWGFKYDQHMQGINMHADFAKVNVNFWITPDEACLDPNSGGMVIYNHPVPKNWTSADYNSNSDKLKAYLSVHEAQSMRVPYRANRCVIFDSSLIHVTDELHFKPGYENRRVNVTLLYGRARSSE